MIYTSFDEILAKVQSFESLRRCVVAGANDEHALEAVFEAQKQNIVFPVLVGDRTKIEEIINKLGYASEKHEIIEVPEGITAAQIAVDLINKGKGDFILKGKIETKDLLKPIVDKKNGLNESGLMTHFGLLKLPEYGKMVVLTDGAMIPYPDLEMKKKMINAVVETLRNMGYERPKVAVLCAVEKVNPKMIETVEAEKLQKMSETGEIENCDIVGPISFDLAISKEAAKVKNYECPYSGEFDVFLAPNMVTGNIIAKIWSLQLKADMAGMIIGAKIPIGLVSRSASSMEKLNSILLCAAACK